MDTSRTILDRIASFGLRLARLQAAKEAPPNCVREVLRQGSSAYVGVAAISAMANLLSLTGSFYMLQVYDRVLPSHSLPTLICLTILMVGLYVAYALFDLIRSRVLSRLGQHLDRSLSKRVIETVQLLPLKAKQSADGLQPIRDVDRINAFLSSSGPVAIFDMPWIPVYLILLYLLHPWLGLTAAAAAVVLLGLAILTEMLSRDPGKRAATLDSGRITLALAIHRNAEAIRAMGMRAHLGANWQSLNHQHLSQQLRSIDIAGSFGAISKAVRLILQSGLLGIGGYLAIHNEATAGVMIAASIISSRALAPVEIAISNWRCFLAARQSYHRLEKLFTAIPRVVHAIDLPRPRRSLAVQDLVVTAPGTHEPILRNVSFEVSAGTALGVIGPSASGKSTLARALVAGWPALRGSIRLDGASIEQWSEDTLGRDVGYLPQDIQLFEGTVAQNIARFDPDASSEAVITAAHTAGAHELIVRLPDGYDTRIGEAGAVLSAGQRQRIALARALYKDPFLVVLDEPNSNLDAEGDAALARAISSIRARGGIAIVIAHRPAALASTEDVLVLVGGQVKSFGPKSEVLRRSIQSVVPFAPGSQPAGVPGTARSQPTHASAISVNT